VLVAHRRARISGCWSCGVGGDCGLFGSGSGSGSGSRFGFGFGFRTLPRIEPMLRRTFSGRRWQKCRI